MDDVIKMNFTQLTTLGTNLQAIHDAFSDAAGDVGATSNLVGYQDLSAAVLDFAGRWRLNREKILESIEKMQKMVTEITETFHEVDGELEGQLKD